MLHAAVKPIRQHSSLRERKKSGPDKLANTADDDDDANMADVYDDDMDSGSVGGGGGGGKVRSKSRRELPAGAVATLKAWLLSPEHFSHPYPTPQDQVMLMQKTGIDKKQLKNWFTNARRRIWKPMLKKQIESGQLAATAGGGIPGSMPGLMLSALPPGASANSAMENPHSVQAIRVHYQQAVQQQQQQDQEPKQAVPLDSFGNPVYQAPGSSDDQTAMHPGHYYASTSQPTSEMQAVDSLGSLPRQSSGVHLSKTDSHAVLMELFARDQDLVRQATESARLKAEAKQQQQQQQQQKPQAGQTPQQQQAGGAQQPQQPSSQHPMKGGLSGSTLQNVPTMNSWPHFSSITSLNNLGTIPGVKSITSLSGADLVSKGNVNKMGNLAQVKSMESMGKNDSYAFLEVFFGDKGGSVGNLSAFGSSSQLLKGRGGDEEDEIGLSLEDESPSQPVKKDYSATVSSASAGPQPAPLPASMPQESNTDSGTLKRAYDDAMAARGLMSVSRSSEKLTDLVLPAKMQRTLSQEYINKEQLQKQQQSYLYTPASTTLNQPSSRASRQYPGQQPVEPAASASSSAKLSTEETGDHVQVPTTTKCSLCGQTAVDTQLRPCGHMFHERCLKPSLQTPRGPPRCPIDNIPMHSAVLAVPTDDTLSQPQNSASTTTNTTTSTTSAAWNYANAQSLPATEK